VVGTPQGPAVMLHGGGPYPGGATGELVAASHGGDVVILTAESRSVDEWRALGGPVSASLDAWLCGADADDACPSGLNSVRTIRLPGHAQARPCPHTTAHWTDEDWEVLPAALEALAGAEVVIFGGGNQHSYVDWPEELHQAVWAVYQRGGVVGGGSAGMSVLAGHVYDGRAADDLNIEFVTSHYAVVDPGPEGPGLSFGSVYPLRFLEGVVTDTHFTERDRFGRTVAFLARLGGAARAIACDGNTSLMINNQGIGELIPGEEAGACFIITPTTPLRTDRPFEASCLAVTRLDEAGQAFDLAQWRPLGGSSYHVDIAAVLTPFYLPADPYQPSPAASAPGCN
jgi:hypothetical protein